MPIFAKLYEFYKELYQILKIFPQKDRYSLGQKIETVILQVFELLFSVNQAGPSKKVEILTSVNAKLDLAKILIRLAKDNKCLDIKKYLRLQEQLQEIGKMAGGWLRYTKTL
ncbi:MAG TPA: diversity-generating retroelement protein Avd [Candidatus Saccharimonadales bacterium]|nr:diversity-generating retroelement protein Avd [Candidatus Saccharimonadales bacterium]